MYQNEVMYMYKKVACARRWHTPECSTCQNVACTRMWHIPECGMYQNVACTRMWHTPECSTCQNVSCTRMWHIPECGMYQNVACIGMWHVPNCGIYQNVACAGIMPVSEVHVCDSVNVSPLGKIRQKKMSCSQLVNAWMSGEPNIFIYFFIFTLRNIKQFPCAANSEVKVKLSHRLTHRFEIGFLLN